MLNFAASRPTRIAAAAIATLIGFGVLWGVATLFQSRGAPFELLAEAERACAGKTYESERRGCIHRWVVDSSRTSVAVR